MKKIAIAMKETIFQIALIHLIILTFQSLRTYDFSNLHMGSILDIQFFYPDFELTPLSNAALFLPVLVLLGYNYKTQRNIKNEPDSQKKN